MKRYLILMLLLICVPVLAQRKLTTNEATILSVGPFFDSTDGITPETSIDVTGLTVEIYRENDAGTIPTRFANFVPTASGGSNDMVLITSSVSGVYSLEITAAQVNFTGPMMLTIVDTDSAGIVGLPFWRYINLTSANVVDAEYGTDKLQVDTTQIGGNTAGSEIEGACDDALTNAGTSTLTAAQVNTEVDNALNTAIPGTPTADSINERIKALDDAYTTTRGGYLDELAAANLPTDIADIPTVSEFNARTLVTSAYYLFGSDEVTTDAASRTASKADVSGLSTHDAAAVKAAIEAGGSTLAQILAFWNSLTITSGYPEVDVVRFHGTAITETSSGRIAGNFSTFWDNADAATSQTVDDVGGGGGGGGDATEAKQDTIIAALAVVDQNVDDVEEDTGTTIPALISAISGGDGSVVVDHNYGGTDELAYKVAGVGVDNAVIRAYLKSDYDAGNTGSAYIKASITTDVNGQWTAQMNLDPETYTLYAFKQNTYGPDTLEVTVE